MSFFWKGKKQYDQRETHGSPADRAKSATPRGRRPTVALEVKLLAMEVGDRSRGRINHSSVHFQRDHAVVP